MLKGCIYQIPDCSDSHSMSMAPDPMLLLDRSFSSSAPKVPDTAIIKKIRRRMILLIFDADCFMFSNVLMIFNYEWWQLMSIYGTSIFLVERSTMSWRWWYMLHSISRVLYSATIVRRTIESLQKKFKKLKQKFWNNFETEKSSSI
jgi:hypothetical protein